MSCVWYLHGIVPDALRPVRLISRRFVYVLFELEKENVIMSLMEIYKVFRNKRKLEPKRAINDCAAKSACSAHCVLQLGNLAVGGGTRNVEYALEPYGRQEQH
jgi:hypothetical protein